MIDQLIEECGRFTSTPELSRASGRLATICQDLKAGRVEKAAVKNEALKLADAIFEMTRVLSGRELDDAVRKTFGHKTVGEVFA